MNPHAGQLVGSFVLSHKIADGGMASVWAAEHRTLGREAAVKFLSTTALDGEVAVERFSREARTIARLSNPHIPQIFDHGVTAEGVPYIVMELVRGTDLRSYLAQAGCLDVAQAVRLVDQMANALGAAHQLGIVHRDVKPENIILTGDATEFHAKLVDFGIAKSTGSSGLGRALTQQGMTIGTPSYMSPEQLMSTGDVDERSDVWSLGVVAYWALTGKLPFDGDTFASVCGAISRAHFTPATELRADLPRALDAWFDRALNRDKNGRFESVERMSRMLRVAVANPEGWTQALEVASKFRAAATPTARVGSSPAISIAGVAHDSQPPSARAPKRWSATASYAASGAALGLCVVLGSSFFSGRMTHAEAAGGQVAPVVLTEATLEPTTLLPEVAPVPVRSTEPVPAGVRAPVDAPALQVLPVTPAAPTKKPAPSKPVAHSVTASSSVALSPVVAKTTPALPAMATAASAAPVSIRSIRSIRSTRASSVVESTTPESVVASPDPDWRPADALGEP